MTDIVRDGVEAGVFATTLEPRLIAETAVALTDGLGARVLAGEPILGHRGGAQHDRYGGRASWSATTARFPAPAVIEGGAGA